MQTYQYIYQGDSLSHLREMQNKSFDLIVTDPPYFNVLSHSDHGDDADWDRQWSNKDAYLNWLGDYLCEFKRLLKPNGGIYLFCSSAQQAAIEVAMAKNFDILNSITWFKPGAGFAHKSRKEDLRRYITQKEHCVFAESKNSDMWAYSGADEDRKIDRSLYAQRATIFEPIRKYLADAWYGSGFDNKYCNKVIAAKAIGSHYFSKSQWRLPTQKRYELLQKACPALNVSYDALKTQYDAMRRTMNLSADVVYTDVWTYKIPAVSKVRHVCEKPIDMMLDIIKASSNEGDMVLDAFAGSGVVGEACRILNRNFVGIEMQMKWAARATNRIKNENIFDSAITET